MSDDLPDDSPPAAPTSSPLSDPNYPLGGSQPKGGCGFAAGAIAGFFLFFIAGGMVLSVGRNGYLGVAYLVVAAALTVWLTTRPDFRGMAVGIFLGLGALLLLWAICSGFHIG